MVDPPQLPLAVEDGAPAAVTGEDDETVPPPTLLVRKFLITWFRYAAGC
jgi:hypothetical protein